MRGTQGSVISAAAEDAAKVAATKVAKETAEQAAQQTAIKLAKESAELAAKKAVIAAASLAAAKDASKLATEKAAKSSAKAVSEDVAKLAVKDVGKETAQTALSKASAFVAKNPKLVIGSLTAGAAAGLAAERVSKTENKKLGITKIEHVDNETVRLTFTPELKLQPSDKVDLAGTDCTPSIDGTLLPISQVLSSTQILLKLKTSAGGSTGTITTHTSFEGQLAGVISGAIAETTGFAGNVVGDTLTKVFPGLAGQFGKIKQYATYALIAAVVIAVVVVILKIRAASAASQRAKMLRQQI